MASALDISTDALFELGAYGPGDSIPDHDAEVCFRYLNRIMDGLNADQRNAYTENIAAYTLSPAKPFYTIGKDPAGVLTADFDAARPVRIDRANLIITSGAYPLRKPLELLNDQQWAKVRIQGITSPIPLAMYNDGSAPLSSLYFYPQPSAAYQVELFSAPLFAPFADLAAQVYFPPLYEDAIVLRLAKRVSRVFTKPVGPDLDRAEREAWDKIQALNEDPPLLSCDPGAFGASTRGTFNIWIGE